MRLVTAAARVVADRNDATIDDFIRAAGVARGTFYNYFPTREDLFEALWAHVGKDPFMRIQRGCASLSDPAERLVCQIRRILDCAAEDEVWGWVIYSMSEDVKTLNADLMAFPTSDLLAGVAAERFALISVPAARDLVVATVRNALRAVMLSKAGPLYREAICRMVLLALGLPESEAGRLSEKEAGAFSVSACEPFESV